MKMMNDMMDMKGNMIEMEGMEMENQDHGYEHSYVSLK